MPAQLLECPRCRTLSRDPLVSLTSDDWCPACQDRGTGTRMRPAGLWQRFRHWLAESRKGVLLWIRT